MPKNWPWEQEYQIFASLWCLPQMLGCSSHLCGSADHPGSLLSSHLVGLHFLTLFEVMHGHVPCLIQGNVGSGVMFHFLSKIEEPPFPTLLPLWLAMFQMAAAPLAWVPERGQQRGEPSADPWQSCSRVGNLVCHFKAWLSPSFLIQELGLEVILLLHWSGGRLGFWCHFLYFLEKEETRAWRQ